MAAVQTCFQTSVGRLLLIAMLAVGLVGGVFSVTHPQWFSGSTSDAGVVPIGGGPGGPVKGLPGGGPIVIGPVK
ncbi:hypothetical protein [Parafrankia discariae]|uniref:hypothetical protein n=1 Tax=Parafrankia discariae TaxID=365528 RepID=UPI00039B36F7|nr:hypothetical protein [Parafrankia discariae]